MTHSITAACTGCTSCTKVCPTGAIQGERKAQHVIDEALCIDCGACGRICPYKAIEDQNGQLCLMVKRTQWKQPTVTATKCVACGACIEVCPTGVLDFKDRDDGNPNQLAYLTDAKNCIGCAFCEAACPTQAIIMVVPTPN